MDIYHFSRVYAKPATSVESRILSLRPDRIITPKVVSEPHLEETCVKPPGQIEAWL